MKTEIKLDGTIIQHEDEEQVLNQLVSKHGDNVIGYVPADKGIKFKNGKPTGEKAFVVFVKKKTEANKLSEGELIPQKIDGVQTDVIEMEQPSIGYVQGRKKPKQVFESEGITARFRPVKLGPSAGNIKITAGTIGGCAKSEDGVGWCTNSHVGCETIRKNLGDQERKCVQPGCFSADTEILTIDGWKSFFDVSDKDMIATLNPNTNELEYQKPLAKQEYQYKGNMYHFNGQMYDLMVTPYHNLYCKPEFYNKNNFGIYSVETALEISNKHNYKEGVTSIEFKKDAVWNCNDMNNFILPIEDENVSLYNQLMSWEGSIIDFHKNINGEVNYRTLRDWKNGYRLPWMLHKSNEFDIDSWLEFFGWWIAEGSLGGQYQEKRGNYIISIRQCNKDNLLHIASIIEKLGFKPNIRLEHGSLLFCSKLVYNYLKQFGHAKDKFIPKEIKDLPPFRLKILLNSLFMGDGTFENGKLRKYSTISKHLADDITELLLKIGLSGTVNFNGHIYKISVNNNNLTPRVTNEILYPYYDGMVYDVTVPNHIIYVRRNGKSLWSGNSYDKGRFPDDYIGYTRYAFIVPQGYTAFNDFAFILSDKPEYFKEPLIYGMDLPALEPKSSAGALAGDVYWKPETRTSEFRYGGIVGTGAVVNVDYGADGTVTHKDCIVATAMSAGGDSGSWCYRLNDGSPTLDNCRKDVNRHPEWYLFAGSSTHTIGHDILGALNAAGLKSYVPEQTEPPEDEDEFEYEVDIVLEENTNPGGNGLWTVSGKVCSDESKTVPVVGALVSLGQRQCVSGGDGGFKFMGLIEGRYGIRCEANGFKSKELEFELKNKTKKMEKTFLQKITPSKSDVESGGIAGIGAAIAGHGLSLLQSCTVATLMGINCVLGAGLLVLGIVVFGIGINYNKK